MAIREFLETAPIAVKAIDGTLTFDIVLVLHKGDDSVKLRIAQYHTNIILIEKNGNVMFETETNRHLDQGHEAAQDSDREGGLTNKELLKDVYKRQVQEKVKSAIENMTGLTVLDVNIKIAGVNMAEEK